MIYWVREVLGWLLVLLGLYVFALCLEGLLASPPRLLQSGPMTLIGFFIFRGGIHLLKVAVAARIATQAQKAAYGPPAPRPARPRQALPKLGDVQTGV